MRGKFSPVTPRTIRRSLRKFPFAPMARQAFLHPNLRPAARIDFGRRPVANFAGNFRLRMKPVRKEDIRRHPAFKFERSLRRIRENAFELFDFRGFRKRQIVAVHAVGPRRHHRPDSEISARVALRTVHSQVLPVLFVAKRYFGLGGKIFRKSPEIPHDKRHAAHGKRKQTEPELGFSYFQDTTAILREARFSGPLRREKK